MKTQRGEWPKRPNSQPHCLSSRITLTVEYNSSPLNQDSDNNILRHDYIFPTFLLANVDADTLLTPVNSCQFLTIGNWV